MKNNQLSRQFLYGIILGVLASLLLYFILGHQGIKTSLTQQQVSESMNNAAKTFNCDLVGTADYGGGVWSGDINCPYASGGMQLLTKMIVQDGVYPPMPYILAQHCQSVGV